MSQHTLRVALATAFVLCSSACGAPWRVVRASTPSALVGAESIGVSFDYSALIMGGLPETEWLMGQPPGDQASYLAVRANMEIEFVDELGSRLAPLPVGVASGTESHLLVVRPTTLEMGTYTVFYAVDSRLDSDLAFGPAGTVTDEIAVRSARTANLYNPTIAGRMNWCARRVAQLAAEYFRRAR